MEREILFRGKIVEGQRKGEWVEGYYVPFAAEKAFILWNYLDVDWQEDEDGLIWFGGSSSCAVDPATVGQCTGIKDKNGRLAYHKDIIRVEFFDPEQGTGCMDDFVVEWDDGKFELLCGENESLPIGFARGGIIVGNVFDNPELLDKNDD